MLTVKEINYTDIRNSIQSGDILACAGKGFMSWLISRFTKNPLIINKKEYKFTHVGTFFWVFGQLFVVEAVGKVRAVRFSTAYHKYKGSLFVIRTDIPNSGTMKKKGLFEFIDKQLALVGKAYDWKALIRIAKKEKRKLNSKWYCSELVNYARDYYYTKDVSKHIKPHEIVMLESNIKWILNNV